MLRLALCTSVQIPNATKARMTKRTMMMMAMTSFFLTMVTGKGVGSVLLHTVPESQAFRWNVGADGSRGSERPLITFRGVSVLERNVIQLWKTVMSLKRGR
jgi:uncharacterized membrane protein